jgi:hypothetical protein
MTLDTPEPPKANGLKTAFDIIMAPKEALETLRVAPTWGWALAFTLVLVAIGNYLTIPAVVHGIQGDWPRTVASNPRLQELTAAQQQQQLGVVLTFIRYTWLIVLIGVPIAMLVQAALMYVGNILGKGSAKFSQLWAAVANIAFPATGLYSIITGVIILVRGADSFNSAADVQTAMPSLALLVPVTATKLHAFLAVFNPFVLWGFALGVATMTIVARVSRGWAWGTALVLLLLFAGLATLGAH